MAIRNREQCLKWVLQEEKNGEISEMASRWWQLSLDELPPGLDYLMLECSVSVGYRLANSWLQLSLSRLGVSVDRVRDLEPGEVILVGKEIMALRRRREKALPGWKGQYQQTTNRANRVAMRLVKLVEESEYV